MEDDRKEERRLAEIKKKLEHYYTNKDQIILKEETDYPLACNIHKEHLFSNTSGKAIFKSLVYKQLLIAQFELLLCSIELHRDPEWCKEKLCNILQLIESFNTNRRRVSPISIADVCQSFIQSTGFIASVTIATNEDIQYVTEWIETEWLITVGVVLAVICNTTLINCCPKVTVTRLLTNNRWAIEDIDFLKRNLELSKFVNILWGRVWQETGLRLMLMISGMGTRKKENTIQFLHQLLKGIIAYSPVKQCLVYVIDSISVKDQLQQCYSAICATTVEWSLVSPLTMNIAGVTLTNFKLCQTQLDLINEESKVVALEDITKSSLNNKDAATVLSDSHKLNLVAMEINNAMMTYPLIHPTHCALWLVHHKLIHDLRKRLLSNDLSTIIRLVFETGTKMREESGRIARECEVIATPLQLCLPRASPKCLIPKRNTEEYRLLHDGLQQSEVLVDCLRELFMIQWRNRCCLLLSSVFPSSKAWKKLQKLKEISVPSGYILPIKEQLILPLLSACIGLSASVQQVCVLLTYSILLQEFWNALISGIPRKRRSSVSRILLSDYQYLQSLMADTSNSLHPDCREMVGHLPLCASIMNNLSGSLATEEHTLEEDDDNGCSLVKETVMVIQTVVPFRKLLNELLVEV